MTIRNLRRLSRSVRVALLLAACCPTSAALAQGAAAAYPPKGITIIIPASPGGAIDMTARLIGPKLTEAWGKPVLVDNKAGATGVIGTDFVAKSAPDGTTLALVASSHAINPSMFRKLPFDTVKGFEPVILTHVVSLMLVTTASLPVKNVQELVAYGKANPGKLSFASSGSGGAPHMSGELFKAMAGIDMLHVPYKGSTAAHGDLLTGRTSLMFDTVAAIQQHVKSGAVRALAVTTAKRSAVAPDVPTMAEAGMQGYETSTWGGILAPAGTPPEVVAKLNAEINKALAAPDVRKRMLDAGVEPAGGSPKDFADFIQSEMTKWAGVAKTAGIQPE